MTPYRPPLGAIRASLHAAGLAELLELEAFSHLGADDVDAVLEGFGTFAADVIAPTDAAGDRFGAVLDPTTASVTVAPEVAEAFGKWVASGWSGLGAPREHGGGGFPSVAALAAEEMFASTNMALSLNPMLSQGAIHLLEAVGSVHQKARFLLPLVSGRWTGTMNLTEPQAGSDVGAVSCRAVQQADGRWAITGSKIFITWGEHDLADNIVHLVLARTPAAPPGTKGISLFIVPKLLVDDTGALGARNHVRCVGLEKKLGIHSSPTCVLEFDGAIGELVGNLHGGMAGMFTMMNTARLSVGLEGLAVSERAFQQAAGYAAERAQGRAPGAKLGMASPIVDHPDVIRMLVSMRAGIDAMRQLLYATAVANDLARHHPDVAVRLAAQARADLLTPMAKAWPADEGVRLTSVALQVHGGMGYIEETGIAQRYRDARIAPIYEGTNGIQAIDLVSRKVRRDAGAALAALLEDLSEYVEWLLRLDGLGLEGAAGHLERAIDEVRHVAGELVAADDDRDWLAGASGFLEMASITVAAGLYARLVVVSCTDSSWGEQLALASRFTSFVLERVARVPAMSHSVLRGAAGLDAALAH